ncbi:MAG: alcohol dehydrogenase catalytic domain-containing protein [Candidatus Limnocylindrales bacterium]
MAPLTIRGAVFRGPNRPVSIESLCLDDPGPGEVRVRMLASGVCHSDLHVVDGEWARPTDVVMGHEGAAIVEAVGEGTTGFDLGDLVVLAWTAPCGACPACRRDEAWLCSSPLGAGHRLAPELVRLHRDDGSPIGVYGGIGTFGEAQVVAAEAAIAIDPRTPPAIAALIGCAVTTGVGAVFNTARVCADESVVVIGAGGVGLSVIMAAAVVGASPRIVVDAAADKADLARRAGATTFVAPAEAGAAVRTATGEGADHVFEAIGLTQTVELAVELTRPGGTTTLVGMTPEADRARLDVYRFVEDGKRLLGSNYGSSVPAIEFPRIAGLYLDGRLPLDLLVTEQIDLDGLEAAFESMRRRDGARRVVVYPLA